MAEWTTESREELKKLYVQTNVTSDELIKDKEMLSEFTKALNSNLLCSHFTDEQVAGEILRIRKTGKLPRIRT